MKKFFGMIGLIALSILLFACGNQSKDSTTKNRTTYQPITLKQVVKKIQNKDDFYLYVGRPTCQYCQRFVPNLEKVIEKTQVTVYYLNTDEEKTEEATAFADKEGIKTVPNLGYYKDGKKINYLVKGSESSLDEIEKFLKQK